MIIIILDKVLKIIIKNLLNLAIITIIRKDLGILMTIVIIIIIIMFVPVIIILLNSSCGRRVFQVPAA